MDNTVLAPPGQGSGGRGLPGDWTSPSRLKPGASKKALPIQGGSEAADVTGYLK